MKLYFPTQQAVFATLLEGLKQKQVLPYNLETLKEKVAVIRLSNHQSAIQDTQIEWLFNYHIFPENILLAATQWHLEGRKIDVGDIILQQIHIPPFCAVSMKIICGVKISRLINEPHKKGFAYETLQGHVEKGISIFTVETTPKAELIFKIQTFSSPATWFAKLLAPIFSLPYQDYCTQRGLINGQNGFQKACKKQPKE